MFCWRRWHPAFLNEPPERQTERAGLEAQRTARHGAEQRRRTGRSAPRSLVEALQELIERIHGELVMLGKLIGVGLLSRLACLRGGCRLRSR